MLKSNLCDYSDLYIVVKSKIDLLAADANENDKAGKDVCLKMKLHLLQAYQNLMA